MKMKRKPILSYASGLMLLLLLAAAPPPKANHNIMFKIASSKNTYHKGEPIIIDLRLINNGKDSEWLYSNMAIGYNLTPLIRDNRGRNLPYRGGYPELAVGSCECVDLATSAYIGTLLNISDPYYGYSFIPGKYKLTMWYTKHNAIYQAGRWQELNILSNEITFIVSEK